MWRVTVLLLLETASALRLLARPVAARATSSRATASSRAAATVVLSATEAVDAALPAAARDPLLLCKAAATTKAEDADAVVDALLTLEKECRTAAKTDEGALSRATRTCRRTRAKTRRGALEPKPRALPQTSRCDSRRARRCLATRLHHRHGGHPEEDRPQDQLLSHPRHADFRHDNF